MGNIVLQCTPFCILVACVRFRLGFWCFVLFLLYFGTPSCPCCLVCHSLCLLAYVWRSSGFLCAVSFDHRALLGCLFVRRRFSWVWRVLCPSLVLPSFSHAVVSDCSSPFVRFARLLHNICRHMCTVRCSFPSILNIPCLCALVCGIVEEVLIFRLDFVLPVCVAVL